MKVFDCFIFFNELDLLEIRLTEMDPFVDVFVLIESDLTFTGMPKALFFQENHMRFRKWLPKIRHMVVSDNPVTDDPWSRERHQRECLRRGLFDAEPDDVVFISDLDEIPSRRRMRDIVNGEGVRFIETLLFYQALNLMTETARTWTASFCAPKHQIDGIANFSDLRNFRCSNQANPEGVCPDAGWHFSSIGGISALQLKLSSFSENSPEILAMNDFDYLSKHLSDRTVWFSGEKLISVFPGRGFPLAIARNPARFHALGLLTNDYAESLHLSKAISIAYQRDLDMVRTRAVGKVDREAETRRRSFMTIGSGLERTYQYKLAEAQAKIANASIPDSKIPHIAAEAIATGATRMFVAQSIVRAHESCRSRSALIEGKRMAAKKAIAKARSAEDIEAATVVDWSL